ncbi:MAG: dihydropteroate synthase [Chloroflexi bacterium]|nr:MAG: dihydropteroate synthase [Chloroflexota bacterium]
MASALIGGRRFDWGSRVYLMGIVNVTPDSFSGDGLAHDPEAAVALGLRMVAEGADLLDVGGESTRPGHTPVSAEEEIARAVPVVARLAREARVPISVDTSKLAVAEAALEAGAALVNDVWGLQRAPGIAALCARREAGLVLMHNQAGHEYGDLLAEIASRLRQSLAAALGAGVPRERVLLDPGIGFGKTAEQNVQVLRHLERLRELGQPLLVGVSRKGFLARIFGLEEPEARVDGTAAAVAAAVLRGADVVRVHDVARMARVVRVAEGLR